MANGIDVNIGADTREFASGVKSGMIEPVQDAQDALEEYARAGDAAGDQLTDTFRQQQRSTADLKTDIEQLNRTIRDSSQPAYRQASRSSDEFRKRSTEGFDEIRESARSNAIEIGASFTGGLDQAVGGVQGFVAEFLAGFGPAGVIAGVGAAALLGVISQALFDGQEAAEAQKAAVAALAGEYIEAGKDGRRTFDSVTDAIKAMATSDGSDVIITLQQAFDKARLAGADYEDVVQSIASGSPAELAKARRAVEQLETAHRRQGDTSRTVARGVVIDNGRQVNANEDLRDALRKAEDQANEAGRAQRLAARAGLSDLSLKRDLLKQLEDGYDDAAGGVDDYLNKEKTVLKVGPYLAAVEKRRKALIEYRDELVKADLTPAAKKFIESQGADAAAAMLAGYVRASPKQKAQLNQVWSTSGTENAASYKDALGSSLAKIKPQAPKIPRPVVEAPDTSRLDAFFRRQQPRLRIGVDLVARNGQRVG